MKNTELHHMHFTLDKKQHALLCDNAKKAGLTKRAFLCRLIMNTPVKARPPEAVHELYVEINRIGTNINQIARNVNAGISDPNDSMDQALFLLSQVYKKLHEIVHG